MEKQRSRHIKIIKAMEGRREAKGRPNISTSVPEKEAWPEEVGQWSLLAPGQETFSGKRAEPGRWEC